MTVEKLHDQSQEKDDTAPKVLSLGSPDYQINIHLTKLLGPACDLLSKNKGQMKM